MPWLQLLKTLFSSLLVGFLYPFFYQLPHDEFFFFEFFQAIKTIAFVFLWHEQFEGAEKLLNFLVKKANMDEGASTRKDE